MRSNSTFDSSIRIRQMMINFIYSLSACFVINKPRYFSSLKNLSCILLLLLTPLFAIANSSDNSVPSNVESSAEQPVISILNKMKESVLRSDYQIYFILQESAEYPTSFRYTHLSSNDKSHANLVYLDGAPKEIILHDNIVSYFQTDSVSFSILANHIIEAFPDVVYNDFDTLTEYYDFVLLGKARTANRSSQLVRIVPKDRNRYNYVIWIDDESHLPLRIDLLDLDSKIISQTKVLFLNFNFDKEKFENYIQDRDYPILFPIDKENSELNKWEVTWLPKGFKETAAYNINFLDANIDTRLFSDGIFSFTINVSTQSNDKSAYVSKQGARTVYSTNLNDMNIVIIGNLPVETIEKIALNVKSK